MVNPADKVSFQKGVVDGVRPLKFSLSEFGISTGILGLYLYLTSNDILRAFQKNKFHYEFIIPIQKKSQILFLQIILQGVHLEKVMKWSFQKDLIWRLHGDFEYPLEPIFAFLELLLLYISRCPIRLNFYLFIIWFMMIERRYTVRKTD